MNYLSKPIGVTTRYRRGPILVVEDNDDHWFIIQWALQRTLPGVDVVRTSGADETLTYLNTCLANGRKLPELVVQDLYLPQREDGWGLLEAIKQHHTLRRLPVILLSHSADPEDIEQSYYLRSASYMVKPSSYGQWLNYFEDFRRYWWESVTLPQQVSY
ncbi:response regulator [Spirosoma soli]|uniref:Response regulator n=1 Tax=Spirosoma soli TaxID=1770529 RepID=A0ABW5M8W6_9BACT